ncbi:MAG: LIC_10190 family membrane protein, partial [Bellilinea sp.]
MLTAALIMTLILVLFTAYGWLTVKGLRKVLRIPEAGNIRPALYVLAGMCVLIVAGQMLSLVMPLGSAAFLVVLAGGLWIVVRFFQSRQSTLFPPKPLPTLGVILLGLIFISVLENSTHAATNPDTGIYHAQAIRWIETFPAVPGLGNLHTRFAYNSSWLVLNALFSLSFLGVQSFHLVPAALTLTVAV